MLEACRNLRLRVLDRILEEQVRVVFCQLQQRLAQVRVGHGEPEASVHRGVLRSVARACSEPNGPLVVQMRRAPRHPGGIALVVRDGR
jgi:hypothetical protein